MNAPHHISHDETVVDTRRVRVFFFRKGLTGGASRIRTADLWIMIPLKFIFASVELSR